MKLKEAGENVERLLQSHVGHTILDALTRLGSLMGAPTEKRCRVLVVYVSLTVIRAVRYRLLYRHLHLLE